MTPWFVLSYPRCRTAWLSVFLTGAGVPCFHEAWKQVSTMDAMRQLMLAQHAPVVVNSDCSNIFFLNELRASFPDARYLIITQSEAAIVASLKDSYGEADYLGLMERYRMAFSHATDLSADTIDCRAWDLAASARLVERMTGRPVDARWVAQASGLLVQLMPWQIEADIHRAAHGDFHHITERIRRAAWA